MRKFARVSEVARLGLPIKASTLYKWRHKNRFSCIFKKFGGFLFVDIAELERLIQQEGRQK